MNYRHHFHAGNYADVFKHAALVALIGGLQRKEKGFLYLDSHAGRGSYELESVTRRPDGSEREPEWPAGIGRLWTEERGPLASYLNLVRRFNRERGGGPATPGFYPGSPWIAAELARPVDRLALCELREDDADALAAEFRRRSNVSVRTMDGYTAVRALLPPPEKRALVLIDPPFESSAEFSEILSALREGLRRLPGGTFAVWYPVTERARTEGFQREYLALKPPPTLVVEMRIASDGSALRMKGCGLLIINPPWKIEADLIAIGREVAAKLGLDDGAGASTFWLVPEA
ncbi:MAG TPA: 23S rRNA (adenine(2030)-N(6))-methyltransferase RlmJ [Candidatus Didemnitutus sp.]|nr:23S rRNA (adenine(2030)-N(6))-methyltransferase RlmJ [Candidatus Didemnitutus sp.]